MDEEGFRDFCAKGERVPPGLTDETILAHLGLVGEFEAFLLKTDPPRDFAAATSEDLRSLV